MMNSQHHELIESLVTDLRPVKPLASIRIRFTLWVVPSVLLVSFLMYIGQEFRSGFVSQLGEIHFLFETVMAFITIITSGYLAYRVSLPGIKVSRWSLWLAISPAILFVGSIIYGQLVESALPPSMAGKRALCSYEILIFGLLSISYFSIQLFNTVPIRLNWLFRLSALASAIIPTALMQIACMYSPDHILKYHIVPMVLIVVIGAIFGPILIRYPSPLE